LNDLTYELSEELRRLQSSPQAAVETISTDETVQPAVFLAELTDDLYPMREEVKRYLMQRDISVLPESYYPRDPETFQEMVRQDLTRSQLFVQLLSAMPFKEFPDLPQGYVRCQFELACKVLEEEALLQWRSPELDLQTVGDPVQRDFLHSEFVYAVGLESFKAAIDFICDLPLNSGNKKVLVLGDMLELGDQSESEHRKMGEYLRNKEIDAVLCYGPFSILILEGLGNIHPGSMIRKNFNTYENLARALRDLLQEGDVLLLKGSRGMQLEKVLEYLDRKG